MQDPRNDRKFLTWQGWTVTALSLLVTGLHIFQIVWVFTSGLRGWPKYAIPVFSGGHMVSVIVMVAFMFMNKLTWMFWVANLTWIGFPVLWTISAILFYSYYRIYLLISTAIGFLMVISHSACITPLYRGINKPVIIVRQPTLPSHSEPPSVEGAEVLPMRRLSLPRTTSQEP